MILRLARQNRLWRFGAICTAMAALATWREQNISDANAIFLLSLEASLLFLVAIGNAPVMHVTPFHAALPIRGRQIFLSRVLPALGAIWLVALTFGGMAWIRGMLNAHTAVQLAECAAAFSVAILLPYMVRFREFRIPVGLLAAQWGFLAAATALICWLLPAAVGLAIFSLAGAGIFIRTWVAIPESFESGPRTAACVNAMAKPRGAPAVVWWPIVRGFPWVVLGFVPMLVNSARMEIWLFAIPFTMFPFMAIRQKMRWLRALPFSHRRLLLMSLIPALLLSVGAAAIGMQVPMDNYSVRAGGPDSDSGVDYETVSVDLPFWKVAVNGKAAVATSPWGESFQPKPRTLLGVPLYNPYAVGPANSKAFSDWQFQRATEAVYGRALDIRHLETAKRKGLRPITSGPRMQILKLSAITLLGLILIWMAEFVQSQWTAGKRFTRAGSGWLLAAAVFVPAVVLALILEFGPMRGQAGVFVTQALANALLFHVSLLLPGSLWAVAAAGAAPVVLIYLQLEKQFAKAQIIGPIVPKIAWRSGE